MESNLADFVQHLDLHSLELGDASLGETSPVSLEGQCQTSKRERLRTVGFMERLSGEAMREASSSLKASSSTGFGKDMVR